MEEAEVIPRKCWKFGDKKWPSSPCLEVEFLEVHPAKTKRKRCSALGDDGAGLLYLPLGVPTALG